MLATTGLAMAEGELNIFNWGNYTNPDLIEKFSKEFDVKVTITDYDSNSTALAKVKAARIPSEVRPGAFVLGTDTVVSLGRHIMGKPDSAAEAAPPRRKMPVAATTWLRCLTVLSCPFSWT